MITTIVYNNYAEVKIVAKDNVEFSQDLDRFKKAIKQEDRKFLDHKRVWKVKNLDKYTRVPFIQQALLDRNKQMELF
jgi:hypothetical protein